MGSRLENTHPVLGLLCLLVIFHCINASSMYGSLSWHCFRHCINIFFWVKLPFLLPPCFCTSICYSSSQNMLISVDKSSPPSSHYVPLSSAFNLHSVMSLHVPPSSFPLKKIWSSSSSPLLSLSHLSASQSTASAVHVGPLQWGVCVLFYYNFLLLLFFPHSSSCSSSSDTLLNSLQSTGRLLKALSLQKGASLSISFNCGWSSICSKDLLIFQFALPPTPHSLSSHISVSQIVCCKVAGPRQWKLLGLYPSLLSPFLTLSPNHFLSAVQCRISAWGSLSNFLTALLCYSTSLLSLPPSAPDSAHCTPKYQVCCVMLGHWKDTDYKKLL